MGRTTKIFMIKLFLILFLISGCSVNASNVEVLQTSSPSVVIEEVSTQEVISSQEAGIKVIDGIGREVFLEEPARRIISLAPSNTEILFALGAGSQVVGRDSFSDYPEAAGAIEDIGGGYGEFDIEKIVSLNPDLVLASELNPEELVTKLEGLNVTVFYLSNPNDLNGMYENLLTVAKLTGHTPETEAIVAELKDRVSAVLTKIDEVEERPVVFYEIDGTDPSAPWTSGKGTFVDTLLTMAGGINLGSVLEDPWAQISIEEIIAQDPYIILIGDAVWGGVTVEDVKARPGWDTLTAIKEGRVYEFDDNIVSRPGPRLVDGLEALASLLHPELFP